MRHSEWKAHGLRALALGLACAAAPALANVDGTLDTSLNPPLGGFPYFGVPGLFDYAIDQGGASPYTNNDSANAMLVQPDGKIVVVGTSWASGTTRSSHIGVIERFLADGTTDTSFGIAGRVLVGNPDNDETYLQSVALQGSSLIVAGIWTWATNLGNDNALLFRVDTHGTVETPFMVGGFSTALQIADAGFNKVVVDSASDIYTAGYSNALSGARVDVNFFDTNGAFRYSYNRPLGTSTQDGARGYDAVLQFVPAQSCGNGCVILAHDELYVVGTAFQGVYPSGLANHDCVIVAFRRTILQNDFSIDTLFNSGGTLTIDFPMGSSNEGDNYCQAAASRPGGGVVIGGENVFISTLGGGTPGPASNYALAEVDSVGNVTRQDAFAFFQELPTPGIYNGIYDIVREPSGKLVVTGYASTSTINNAPSDVGVIRFNPDFTRDATFGNNGLGSAILSLDGQGALMFTGQREWGSRLALDSRGRIVLIGERSYNIGGSNPNDYDWLIARLNNSDVIFRDGLDGVVPN